MIDLFNFALTPRLLVLAAAMLAPLALTGCNAVEGLGEDLQESSENVREAAEDADE